MLVVASMSSLFLIPDSSNPNHRDAEDWLLLPLMLASIAVGAALFAALLACACLVRRERLGVRTVVPLIAGTGLTLLPVLWLTAAFMRW